MAVRAHDRPVLLAEPLLEQRVMDELADVQHHEQRQGCLIEEDDQLADTVVVQDQAAGVKGDDRDQHDGYAEKRYPAATSRARRAPQGRRDCSGGTPMKQRYEERQRRDRIDPVRRDRLEWGVREDAPVADQAFCECEAQPGGHTENEAVDRRPELRQHTQKQCRDWHHDELNDREDDPVADDRQAGRAQAPADDPFRNDRDRDPQDDAAAERRSEHQRRFLAIHLRLVEIDDVQRRHQEDRDQHGCGDETGCGEHHDEGEPQQERPAEFLELPLPEVREECREDRRLRDVLTRVRREMMGTLLSRYAVVSQPLMRTAVGAEDRVGHLLAAVVARHRLILVY